MKLLILGSSLARDLSWYYPESEYTIGGKTVKICYESFIGKSFEYFVDNPKKIDKILCSHEPQLILVIFGANSISTRVPKKKLLENCRDFYQLLKNSVLNHCPETKIIAHQVPLRFVYNGFKNTPDPETFKLIRTTLNNKIRKLKTIDYYLVIGGSDWTKLDHEEYFRDGIHFECFAIEIQFELIVKKLEFIFSKHD